MASKYKDLREASADIDRVKQLASRVYGFKEYLVKPLEADQDDPSAHCAFEVCGIKYQVDDGALSIVAEEG